MKTIAIKEKLTTQQSCVNLVSSSLLQPPSWFKWWPFKSAPATSSKQTKIASAFHSLHAGLVAQAKSANLNSRIAIAIALIAVCAPATYTAFLLFPAKPINPQWFYLNWHYYLLTIGPHLYILTTLTGVFLLFPAHSKRAYFLLLPGGTITAQIINLSLATSNADINHVMEWYTLLLGTGIILILFITADYLTHRKYHQYDALMARAKGLMDCNIDKDVKLKHLKTVFEDLRQFHRQF